jgi:hypothetical protein
MKGNSLPNYFDWTSGIQLLKERRNAVLVNLVYVKLGLFVCLFVYLFYFGLL